MHPCAYMMRYEVPRNPAPELLAALQDAVKEFELLPRSLGYDFTHLPKLKAVIAKATGATP